MAPSTDLVVQSTAYSRANLTERQQYIRMLATAGTLLPQHLRGAGNAGDPGKAFLLAETGDMLGIHPMAAVVGVHIIEGKPSLSANLMTGLVRKAGHKLRVSVTGKIEDESLQATAQLIRQDDPDFTFEVTWTLEDAKRANLYPGKAGSNWQKYTRAMLKSRVTSEIVREGASDVLMGGNVYTPEELGAQVDEQGDPIELKQTDVSRETPPETPIVDNAAQTEEAAASVQDYIDRVSAAETSADVKVIYQAGRTSGLFTEKIIPSEGADEVELGAWIIEIGTALKAIEEEVTEGEIVEETSQTETGTAAVLDPDVVDAEIIADNYDEAAEIAKHEAEIARAEAEEKKESSRARTAKS